MPVKKKQQPVILITNDDGVTAPGIKNLVEAVKGLGKVVVVAPDKPQSGMGHAITWMFLMVWKPGKPAAPR
jgi:5'-nucleotidase